jgi:gluconate kinase
LGFFLKEPINPDLLRSQLADLEEPAQDEGTATIELGRSPEETVEEIKAKLGLPYHT